MWQNFNTIFILNVCVHYLAMEELIFAQANQVISQLYLCLLISFDNAKCNTIQPLCQQRKLLPLFFFFKATCCFGPISIIDFEIFESQKSFLLLIHFFHFPNGSKFANLSILWPDEKNLNIYIYIYVSWWNLSPGEKAMYNCCIQILFRKAKNPEVLLWTCFDNAHILVGGKKIKNKKRCDSSLCLCMYSQMLN